MKNKQKNEQNVKKSRYYDKIEYITEDEFRRLLKACEDEREKAIIQLMFTKGLRASEVCMLKVKDVNLETRRIYVRRLKNSVSNYLPLLDEDIMILKKYLKKREEKSEYLFLNKRGQKLTRFVIFNLVRKLCKKANIPIQKAHPHALRHGCGVFLLEKTGDVKLCQDVLGHRDIRNTIIYSRYVDKVRDEKYLEAFEKLK